MLIWLFDLNIDINLFSLLYVVKFSYKLCDLAIDDSVFMDDYSSIQEWILN